MRVRTYQNKDDKKNGSFHVQATMDLDEAKAFVAGKKEVTKELIDQTKEIIKTTSK